MNKYLNSIIIITFLLTAMGQAQINAGLVIGGNSSVFAGDAPERVSYSRLSGISLSAAGEFGLTEDVSINFEVNYQQRGAGLSVEQRWLKQPLDTLEIRLNYLNVPVSVRVYAAHKKTYISGGLALGYLLSANKTDLVGSGGTAPADNLFKEFDLSLLFGFGLMLPVANDYLNLEIRFSQSILNISEIKNEQGEVLPTRVRSGVLELRTGWYFDL